MIDIRTSKLGQYIEYVDMIDATQAVWGGIAWPCEDRAGYIIVVGACKERHPGGYELCVLDDYESFDVRELIRQCVAMDLKYWVSWRRIDQSGDPEGRWLADETHDAARDFLTEANEEFRRESRLHQSLQKPRQIRIRHTALLEKERLYDFLLPQIKLWLQPDRMLLYLKDSKVALHLQGFDAIDASDISGLKIGYCPAIEALGYVTVELQNYLKRQEVEHREDETSDMGVQTLLEV
jgi:hypothetical protein